MGYGLDHPVMRKGTSRASGRFTIDEARGLAFSSLHVAGMGHRLGGARLAAAGLRRATIRPCARRRSGCCRSRFPTDAPGDWRVKCEETSESGWAFEFDNDVYPDIDDTTDRRARTARRRRCEARRACDRARRGVGRSRCARERCVGGIRSRQHPRTLYRMPFSDFGAMIDPPTEDVTAHVLEMLAALGRGTERSVRRARPEISARNAEAGRLVVRALGRQLHLRNWCVVSALAALAAPATI